VILTGARIANIKIRLHIRPLAQVKIQVSMGIGIAILAVNVIDSPDRVSYGMSSILKQRLLSFKSERYPLKKKDKKRFLNQGENFWDVSKRG
jgi:hypothetical protein